MTPIDPQATLAGWQALLPSLVVVGTAVLAMIVDLASRGPDADGVAATGLLGLGAAIVVAVGLWGGEATSGLAGMLRLDRFALFVQPLHPNVAARAFYWRRGAAAIEVNEEDHTFTGSEEQVTSPIHRVRSTREEIRRRLEDRAARLDFPVLEELREQGITDYLIMPLEFLNGEVHGMSVGR